MSAVPRKRQIELLQQLLMMDVWSEFLLPEYKEANDIIIMNAKSAKDPHVQTHFLGQSVGLDAIINLPRLLEVLQQQEAAEAQLPPPGTPAREMSSADNAEKA